MNKTCDLSKSVVTWIEQFVALTHISLHIQLHSSSFHRDPIPPRNPNFLALSFSGIHFWARSLYLLWDFRVLILHLNNGLCSTSFSVVVLFLHSIFLSFFGFNYVAWGSISFSIFTYLSIYFFRFGKHKPSKLACCIWFWFSLCWGLRDYYVLWFFIYL